MFNDRNRISALNPEKCLADCLEKVTPVGFAHVFDELYQYLGVSLAFELVTIVGQELFQHGIVLNRSVVNQGNLATLRKMGMGIRICRLAVSGPSRMSYSKATGSITAFCNLLKI